MAETQGCHKRYMCHLMTLTKQAISFLLHVETTNWKWQLPPAPLSSERRIKNPHTLPMHPTNSVNNIKKINKIQIRLHQIERPRAKGKYQGMDNIEIGIKRGNSYQKK